MALAPPPPVSANPLRRVAFELGAERRAGGMPPGATRPSLARTRAMIRDPLTLLLDLYERASTWTASYGQDAKKSGVVL